MKQKRIGILGGLVSNDNMGCTALTYSLLRLLQNIAEEKNVKFTYTIFEPAYKKDRYDKLIHFLHLELDQISYCQTGYISSDDWKLTIKRTKTNFNMIKHIRNCDLVIDLTMGDSFTDIYGSGRFSNLTNFKKMVEVLGIPLVLGPQTYGPFSSEKSKEKAKRVIENAGLVISRDQYSKDYLDGFVNKDIFVATDLAFSLPYEKKDYAENDGKIRVGVNPSALLVSKKVEKTNLQTTLTVDYDKYVTEVLMALVRDGGYEVHLVPHVGDDAVEFFSEIEGVISHTAFVSPIEAKNIISTMDIFIASRMHASIAAFSTGVATIPVAYSRKFSGLYQNLNYPYIVDLTEMDTESAVDRTLEYVRDYKKLIRDAEQSMKRITELQLSLRTVLGDYVEANIL